MPEPRVVAVFSEDEWSIQVNLDGPRYQPAGKVQRLVVLLHGLGVEGEALAEMAGEFAGRMPGTAVVAPNAPFAYDSAASGYQWFSAEDHSTESSLKGAREAAPSIDAFLDRECARYGVSNAQVALIGFSQGAMMALHTSLRRKSPVAMVGAYSGKLIAPAILKDEIRSRPPVLLIHGEADQAVPASFQETAREALEANGVPVTTEICKGLGHRIDERGIALGIEVLAKSAEAIA